MRSTLLWLTALLFTGCTVRSQSLVLYEKGKIYPHIEGQWQHVRYFQMLFRQATGEALRENASGGMAVTLKLDQRDFKGESSFSLSVKDASLTIAARDEAALQLAVNYLFSTYGALAGYGFTPATQRIEIPASLHYGEHYDFDYREPYFAPAMNKSFTAFNSTQLLHEYWGLWGHNIGKVITVTPQMLAKVDGEVQEEQFCFSSPELEDALSNYISQRAEQAPQARAFMVTPNDSDIVCLCDKCKAAGNSRGNASPAVFSMLNRLAKAFPEQQLFSAGYSTTQTPPPFRLEPNAGVMISTMAFPKGVVIAGSAKKADVENTLASWKNVAGKMFLWDYAINFDNYHEFYPTLLIAQQNLKFYKERGISGAFMQGNEDGSAAFDELKAYVYAQLLRDVNLDVRQHIRNFCAGRYPSGAKYISGYYLALEAAAFSSPRQLDIYGGVRQAKRKYLDEKALLDLYPLVVKQYAQPLPEAERAAYRRLLLSLTFQRLELMRTNGVGEGGYAPVPAPGQPAVPNPEVPALLGRLKDLQFDTAQPYNESGDPLSQYLQLWETEIIEKPYQNMLLGKKLQLLSEPDEEYADVRMLTDGARGFFDYYNNWMLTTGAPISVAIKAADITGARVLQMDFLHNPRHRIYAPKSVIVAIDGVIKEVPVPAAGDVIKKRHVSIPLALPPGAKLVTVTLVKQPEFNKRSVACDEIIIH